jgi:hypothetical protein
MDFSTAPTKQTVMGELIPHGTLAWAIVQVRPHNADADVIPVPSKTTQGNSYLDLELTIDDGLYDGRKVWTMVGVAGKPQYTEQGAAAIRHMLEAGKGASPSNTQGYVIDSYMELDGLRVAVEIGVEKGGPKPDGGVYPDKNRVTRFLSPSPESDTHAKFQMLVSGQQPGPKLVAPKAAVPAAPAPAARSAPAAAPAWLKQ